MEWTWDGPEKLNLVLWLQGVGQAIGVDDVRVQALGLQPHMVCAPWEALELRFQGGAVPAAVAVHHQLKHEYSCTCFVELILCP